MQRLAAACLAICLAGCASYQPRPLDAAAGEARFRERTLQAPFEQAPAAETAADAALPPETWDLAALTRVALHYHSDLDVARARAEAAEAALLTAGERPNPTLGFSPMGSLNPDPGQSPWTIGLVVDIPIEIAGKRGCRITQAAALSESARLELAETAWMVRSRLRAALLDYVFNQRDLAALESERDARQKLIGSMEQRIAAGEAAATDLLPLRLDLDRTIIEIRSAQSRIEESRAVLAQALGLPAGALSGAALDAQLFTQPPEADVLAPASVQRIGLLNRLDIRRALSDYAAAEAALQLEVARQYPDIHLGPGYEFDQGQNRLTLGVSMELPIFNQNQGPIAEAEAHRREAEAKFDRAQAQAFGQMEQALARYRGALAELAEAQKLVAAQGARLDTVRRALQLGEEDRVALESEELVGTSAQRIWLESMRKAQAALGGVEDAVQRPLDPPPPAPSPPAPETALAPVHAGHRGPAGDRL